MRLYAGMSSEFRHDTTHNRYAQRHDATDDRHAQRHDAPDDGRAEHGHDATHNRDAKTGGEPERSPCFIFGLCGRALYAGKNGVKMRVGNSQTARSSATI